MFVGEGRVLGVPVGVSVGKGVGVLIGVDVGAGVGVEIGVDVRFVAPLCVPADAVTAGATVDAGAPPWDAQATLTMTAIAKMIEVLIKRKSMWIYAKWTNVAPSPPRSRASASKERASGWRLRCSRTAFRKMPLPLPCICLL